LHIAITPVTLPTVLDLLSTSAANRRHFANNLVFHKPFMIHSTYKISGPKPPGRELVCESIGTWWHIFMLLVTRTTMTKLSTLATTHTPSSLLVGNFLGLSPVHNNIVKP